MWQIGIWNLVYIQISYCKQLRRPPRTVVESIARVSHHSTDCVIYPRSQSDWVWRKFQGLDLLADCVKDSIVHLLHISCLHNLYKSIGPWKSGYAIKSFINFQVFLVFFRKEIGHGPQPKVIIKLNDWRLIHRMGECTSGNKIKNENTSVENKNNLR